MRVTKAGGRGNGTSSMAGYIGVTGTVAEEPLIPKPQSWYKVMFPQASGLVTKAFRLTEFEVLSSAKKKKWNFEGTKNNSRRVQGGSAPYAQTAKPAALKVVKKRGAARRGKVRLQVACCSLSGSLFSVLFSPFSLYLSCSPKRSRSLLRTIFSPILQPPPSVSPPSHSHCLPSFSLIRYFI